MEKLKLLLGGGETTHERQDDLLELRKLLELYQVLLDVELYLLVIRFVLLDLADPRVVKKLGYRGSCDLISVQTLKDEIFRIF